MSNYQHQPDATYGIELRDNWSVEDYVAQSRGFRSTAEFLEYRDASPARQAEMRANRDKTTATNDVADEGEPMRFAALLNLKAK